MLASSRDVHEWLPEHHMRLDPARAILRGRPAVDACRARRHLALPLGEQRPPAGDRVQSAPLSMAGQRWPATQLVKAEPGRSLGSPGSLRCEPALRAAWGAALFST